MFRSERALLLLCYQTQYEYFTRKAVGVGGPRRERSGYFVGGGDGFSDCVGFQVFALGRSYYGYE